MSLSDSISYTVSGHGGLSQPILAFRNSSFWWADSVVEGTVVPPDFPATLGFHVRQGGGGPKPNTKGSVLLSSSFSLAATEVLAVQLSVFTGHANPFSDVGFALLLKHSMLNAILANLRPDNIRHFDDLPHPPSEDFTPPSANVLQCALPHPISNSFELAGSTYGPPLNPGGCHGNCATDVTASVCPGAGTYQLLFGVFGGGSLAQGISPTAIAVKSVSS
jgi:hypothetical protein